MQVVTENSMLSLAWSLYNCVEPIWKNGFYHPLSKEVPVSPELAEEVVALSRALQPIVDPIFQAMKQEAGYCMLKPIFHFSMNGDDMSLDIDPEEFYRHITGNSSLKLRRFTEEIMCVGAVTCNLFSFNGSAVQVPTTDNDSQPQFHIDYLTSDNLLQQMRKPVVSRSLNYDGITAVDSRKVGSDTETDIALTPPHLRGELINHAGRYLKEIMPMEYYQPPGSIMFVFPGQPHCSPPRFRLNLLGDVNETIFGEDNAKLVSLESRKLVCDILGIPYPTDIPPKTLKKHELNL